MHAFLKLRSPFIPPSRPRDRALILGIALALAAPAGRTFASSEVPFHAQLTQTVTPTTCPADAAPAAVCFHQTGTGIATDLGRMTKESLTQLSFVSATCGTFVEFTAFTAANGDTITAVQNGTGCYTSPTTAVGNATYTITGGTGRFRGVKGSGTATTTLTAVAPGVLIGPATYDGVLSSPKSLK
jgi:hypothetical protein